MLFKFQVTRGNQSDDLVIGFYREYEHGTIFWRRDLGASYVHGKIFEKYSSLKCEAGVLGYPLADNERTADRLGEFTEFERGAIGNHPSIVDGPFVIQGAIFEKWKRLGRDDCGFPLADEAKTADRTGRCSHFRRLCPNCPEEEVSIYWTPSTGVHAVRGAIRQRWASLGWESSYLGYPVSDEVDCFDSDAGRRGRISWFQGGYILCWSGDQGVMDGQAPTKTEAMPGC